MNTIRIAALCLALAPLAHAGGEDGPYVWTGKRGMITRGPRVAVEVTSYGKDGPSEVRRIPPDAHARALRAELAELRVAEATDGPSEELDAARLELWIRACDGESFEGQGALLVELALERAERLALRGAGEAALEATQELLLPGRLLEAAGEFELAPADAAWLERAAAWLADPRLVALRAELAPPPAAQAVSTDVEAVITEHLYKGNRNAVLQFGARAVPVCEAYLAAHPRDYPAEALVDPLTILFELDEVRGARFALAHLEEYGEVFPLRVLRSMRAADVLGNSGTWNFVEVQRSGLDVRRAELLQAAWRDLLERLVEQRTLASDAFTEVGQLIVVDALSPRLAEALEKAIRGEDGTRFEKAMAALGDAGMRESARPLLGRLLDHPMPHVRASVAQALARFEEVPELWPLADDPAPEVRRAVVEALRPRSVRALSVLGFGRTQVAMSQRVTDRGLDRGGMEALESLLLDDEPDIYLAALDILKSDRDRPVSSATLRNLTTHRDARVRGVLPRLNSGGLPYPEILEALADDPELDVRDAVDQALGNVANLGPAPTPERPLQEGWRPFLGASTTWSDAYLPALLRRLQVSDRVPQKVDDAPYLAGLTPAGAKALAGQALATEADAQRQVLVQYLAQDARWAGGLHGFHLVPPQLVRDLLARAWRNVPDEKLCQSVLEAIMSGPDVLQAEARMWPADTSLPWTQRMLGLRLTSGLADEAWCDRLLGLLSEPTPLRSEPRTWSWALHELGSSVRGREAGQRLFGLLAEAKGPSEEALGIVLSGLQRSWTPDPRSAERLLERWGDRGGMFIGLAMQAMEHLEASEEEPKLELFERMLRVDGDIAGHTTQAMGRLHLRAHLPLLERALLGELGAGTDQREAIQMGAARALACYLDDEAAELLLRGVGTTSNADVREVFFTALDTIRRYQDERARWNARSDSKQARVEAIAELVGMIETGDGVQRVQAVRALGTLGAIEELPRLVRLTGSKEAALAAAAQEALEAIRAAQQKD